MSSFIISVEHSRDATAISEEVKNRNDLVNLMKQIASGALTGDTLTISTSPNNLVSAAATATITFANIANNDTIALFGVTLTCVTGTPTTGQFKKLTDATVTAANLVTAANANATIAKHCVATSAAGVVTFTLNMPGSLGNFLEDVTKSSTGITLAQWSGGTGGVETAPQSIEA